MKNIFKNYILYISVLFIAIIVLLSARFYSDEFYENILVEMHGVIFDTLVIGLVITIWAKKKDTDSKIESLKKEYEIYKAWKSPESSFKMYKIFNSLKEYGIELDLSHVNFNKIEIEDFEYHSDLSFSNFTKSILNYCDLRYASFKYSVINNTKFFNCDFRGVNFFDTELTDCYLYACSFNSSIVQSITFKNVHFEGVDFRNAHLIEVKFVSCKFINVNFENTASFKSNFGDNFIPEGAIIVKDSKYSHNPTKIWLKNQISNLKKKSKISQRIENEIFNPFEDYV